MEDRGRRKRYEAGVRGVVASLRDFTAGQNSAAPRLTPPSSVLRPRPAPSLRSYR